MMVREPATGEPRTVGALTARHADEPVAIDSPTVGRWSAAVALAMGSAQSTGSVDRTARQSAYDPERLLTDTAESFTETLRYSIVLPVYNESENIGAFCQACRQLPPGYELLVCYDHDEDTTLPALEALPRSERPARIRLIRNRLGRGVRHAIEAGFRAARAPVVLVTMADLSDDFSRVGEMLWAAEQGADVVCGSRYMRGGRQQGGPWLKSKLSRLAGWTLRLGAGLPTWDATNSFKVYRREFLDRTEIESTAGFCLGLELVVKAHFGGGTVCEVPASWQDRTAGESRFRLWAWLPHYWRWYRWAMVRRAERLWRNGPWSPHQPEA